MKIKVIDLLNMISKGEKIPKKVEYSGVIFKNKNGDLLNDIDCSLFEHRGDGDEQLLPMLNDEVEIIEEQKKIPEKIDLYEDEEGHYFIDKHCKKIYVSCDEINFMVEEFNQLIDYLQSKGE